MTEDALVKVTDLRKLFPIRKGLLRRTVGNVHAVNGVNFEIHKGETFALVGESGCGKSTIARLLVNLLSPSGGEVSFDGKVLGELDKSSLRIARRDFQIVFQDPFGSLNPRMTVRDLIEEPLRIATRLAPSERRARAYELIERVGLSREHAMRHPHEFSGGQRQRIGIARALALSPKFVVCDEPVSALDVSVQAQIINLLKELQRDFGLTYLFVSHDLAIVSQIATRVAVMYLGQVVELADTTDLFERPGHPYTQALLNAVPVPDPDRSRKAEVLGGELPSPINLPQGCAFHPRCPIATDICRQVGPELTSEREGHLIACHHVDRVGAVTGES